MELQQQLCDTVVECLARNGGTHSLRDVGRYLQATQVNGRNALDIVRESYRNLGTFLDDWPDLFLVRGTFLNLKQKAADSESDADLAADLAADLSDFDQEGEGSGDSASGGYRSRLDDQEDGDVDLDIDVLRNVRVASKWSLVKRTDLLDGLEATEEGAEEMGQGDSEMSGMNGTPAGVYGKVETDKEGDIEMDVDKGGADLAPLIHPSVVPDLKVTQLRELLREYGCAVSGNKSELVERLVEAMHAHQTGGVWNSRD